MPANGEAMELLSRLIAPWRWLTDPVFVGLDRLPDDRPIFFVGNHTLMGMLDVPLLMDGLWREKGIVLHSLGDRLHFGLPGWRDLIETFGVIEGSPDNCREAMADGKSLIVFPGGAREVMKRKSEKYKLIWGDRCGFARIALETGATIVPIASVGADDCFDILIDGDDLLKSPIGPLIERFHPRPDFLPPIVRGMGLTLLPRPERFYFNFGEPIEATASRPGEDHTNPDACMRLRCEVQAAVEAGLAQLLKLREDDPKRRLRDRFWRGREASDDVSQRGSEGDSGSRDRALSG